MRFGSLFSGIGGIDLGLEWAGMECARQVEIDDFCQKVLQKHWPTVPKYRDIREVGSHNLEPVDLICGGFPCQPFSVAGRRRGEEDDRYLWPEMLRVICEIQPAWVLGENVAGIVSMAQPVGVSQLESRYITRDTEQDLYEAVYTQKERMQLGSIYQDLENIGYEVQAFVIPACGVDAPHKRDRVWIVAHSRNHQRGNGEPGSPGRDDTGELESTQRSATSIEVTRPSETSSLMAHTNGEAERGFPLSENPSQPSGNVCEFRGRTIDGRKTLRHTSSERLPDWAGGEMGQPRPVTEFERPGGREIERDFRGIPYGVSHRVDRLRALGNAVVPQVVAEIGRAIMLCS